MNAEQLLKHFDRIAEAPDAVPRLRRFILDLAVRGKLVEQDSSNEPAAELLKRIQSVKASRNLKDRAKPGEKIYVADNDQVSYQLPSGWAWTSLANLTAVLNGRAYSKNELLDEGTPVLRVGNLFTSDHWYYSNLTLDDDKYCDEGDLLFSWSASFGPFIWRGPRVIYHYHIWKLSLHDELNLDKNYFYRFLLHKTQEIKDSGHGVSMLHMTKENMELVRVPLPPLAEQHRIVAKVDELMALCDRLEAAQTKREQRRDRLVAAGLRQLQDEEGLTPRRQARQDISPSSLASLAPCRETVFLQNVSRLTTRPEHIKALRQSILNLAVRGKLAPQAPRDEPATELLKRIDLAKRRLVRDRIVGRQQVLPLVHEADQKFSLPPGWVWTRLGVVSELVTSGSRDWAKHCSDKGAIFVRMGNLSKGHYRLRLDNIQHVRPPENSEGARARLQPWDILISITGDVGMLGLVPEGFGEAYINQHTALVRPMEEVRGRYLAELFRSPFAQNQFNAPQRGIKNSFRLTDVTEFVVPLPPLAEQHRIVAKVDELMAVCDQLEANLTTTQTDSRRLLEAVLRDALAPALETAPTREALFTGTAAPQCGEALRSAQVLLSSAVPSSDRCARG